MSEFGGAPLQGFKVASSGSHATPVLKRRRPAGSRSGQCHPYAELGCCFSFKRIGSGEEVHKDFTPWDRPYEQETNLPTAPASDEVALATADVEPISAAATRTSEVHDLHSTAVRTPGARRQSA